MVERNMSIGCRRAAPRRYFKTRWSLSFVFCYLVAYTVMYCMKCMEKAFALWQLHMPMNLPFCKECAKHRPPAYLILYPMHEDQPYCNHNLPSFASLYRRPLHITKVSELRCHQTLVQTHRPLRASDNIIFTQPSERRPSQAMSWMSSQLCVSLVP